MLETEDAARLVLRFRAVVLAATGACLIAVGGLFSGAQAGEGGGGLTIGGGIIGLNILDQLTNPRNGGRQTTTPRRPARVYTAPRKSTKSRAAKQTTPKQNTKSSGKGYTAKARTRGKGDSETAATAATGAATAISADPSASPASGLPPSAVNPAPPPALANLAADLTPIRDALEQMGYGPGLETGMIGPRLQQAIVGFQQDLGAAPTGVLTPDQLQVLYTRHASMKAAIGASLPPPR